MEKSIKVPADGPILFDPASDFTAKQLILFMGFKNKIITDINNEILKEFALNSRRVLVSYKEGHELREAFIELREIIFAEMIRRGFTLNQSGYIYEIQVSW